MDKDRQEGCGLWEMGKGEVSKIEGVKGRGCGWRGVCVCVQGDFAVMDARGK